MQKPPIISTILALSALIALLAYSSYAQPPDTGIEKSQAIFESYNVASGTYIFCDSGGAPAGIRCDSGAGADDGWITANGVERKAIQVEIDTINATSLDFRVEARLVGNEGQAAQIWPGIGDHVVTATGSFIVNIPDPVYQVRLGLKISGDSGAQDVDAVYNSFPKR
jgi:hypothetical protein